MEAAGRPALVAGGDDGQHVGSLLEGVDQLGVEDPLVLRRPRDGLPGVGVDQAGEGGETLLTHPRLRELQFGLQPAPLPRDHLEGFLGEAAHPLGQGRRLDLALLEEFVGKQLHEGGQVLDVNLEDHPYMVVLDGDLGDVPGVLRSREVDVIRPGGKRKYQ